MVLFLYAYANTKTEPVDFHDYMVKFERFPDDPSNAEVDLLNEKRARLHSLLLSQPNTKAVLEAIEEYLPLLIKFLNFCENHKLVDKFTSIRKTIAGDFEKPMVKSQSIYYEVIYVHMAYAYTLSNMAVKKATSDCSEAEINMAVDLLCRASGVFQFLSTSYGRTWEIQDGPPETTSSSLAALAELALADAQQLVCLKAEKKKLQPSALIKLKAAIVVKYSLVDSSLRRCSSDYDDMARNFKQHIEFVGKFFEANLLLQLARNSAEENNYGPAVAAITGAHNLFLECIDCSIDAIKTASRDLMNEADQLHSSYVKMNNHVAFQQVPSLVAIQDDYKTSARLLIEPKPFILPSSSSSSSSSAQPSQLQNQPQTPK